MADIRRFWTCGHDPENSTAFVSIGKDETIVAGDRNNNISVNPGGIVFNKDPEGQILFCSLEMKRPFLSETSFPGGFTAGPYAWPRYRIEIPFQETLARLPECAQALRGVCDIVNAGA